MSIELSTAKTVLDKLQKNLSYYKKLGDKAKLKEQEALIKKKSALIKKLTKKLS
jgi:hypothetical protein